MNDKKEIELPYIAKWTSVGDVQKVWRRFGWRPPTEYREDYLFAQNREEIVVLNEQPLSEIHDGTRIN
jgi:hypothetical protein